MAVENDDQLVERLVPKILASIRSKAKAVESLDIRADLDGITSIPCYDTTGEQFKCVLVAMDAIVDTARKPLEEEIEKLKSRFVCYTNLTASEWVADSSVEGYSYRCDLDCACVKPADYAEVLFTKEESLSGNYAAICETKDGVVSIWGAVNKAVTIPMVMVERLD